MDEGEAGETRSGAGVNRACLEVFVVVCVISLHSSDWFLVWFVIFFFGDCELINVALSICIMLHVS